MDHRGKPKGHPKTGGRTKGTPNKNTQELIELADKLSVNPFEILLMIADGDWKGLGYPTKSRTQWTPSGIEYEEDTITVEMRLSAAKEACQYLYPKRKAVELSAGDGYEPVKVFELKYERKKSDG